LIVDNSPQTKQFGTEKKRYLCKVSENRKNAQFKKNIENEDYFAPALAGGKLPPQAPDLEEAVLGALMLEKESVEKLVDILSPQSFYITAHQHIFGAISDLFAKGSVVDILTVTDHLRKNEKLESVGGAYYIAKLTNRISSAANIEFHAHIITQKFIQRELIKVSNNIAEQAFEPGTDAFELLDNAEKKFFEIKERSIKRSFAKIDDLLKSAIHQIENLKDNEAGVTGIGSGFSSLDKFTAGWQKSDLVIIAARPGMGKTAFALAILRNAAIDYKKSVAIFSLEMSSVQLVTRLIAMESEISSEKLKRGELQDYEWQQINSKITALSNAQIYIDDTPGISILEFKAKCRRLKSQHNLEMVIVDYLQLMRSDDKNAGNREQEISYISRSLKGLAKELEIPVIALAQLSREVEKRTDKKPMLSDLRESGSIEQDADMVSFIYRPEYYKINTDADGNDTSGMAEIILEKHRNGPTGIARVRFIPHLAKFSDINSSDYEDFGALTGGITVSSKMNVDNEDPMHLIPSNINNHDDFNTDAEIVEDDPFDM